jgi:hypothetical protein
VLDYSELSSGAFTLDVGVLSVPDVVNAVVRNCKASLKTWSDAREHHYPWVSSYSQRGPAEISIDIAEFGQ